MDLVDLVFVGGFFLFWVAVMAVTVGGVIVGIVSLISASQVPSEAFGPWWDNTKTAWLLGMAVSFAVPLGTVVVAWFWFTKGRAEYRATGVVDRPFWAGPPKPMPHYPPPTDMPPPPPSASPPFPLDR